MFRCPKCGNNNDLCVNAIVTVQLSFFEDGEIEGSEPVDGNHEWDDDSPMFCGCGFKGQVRDFCKE